MADLPPTSASRPLPWLLLGLAAGLLLSFAGIGLLKSGVKEAPTVLSAPVPAPASPQGAFPAGAETASEVSEKPVLDDQRAMYAAQFLEAEAEWARQLEAARTGTETARREAVQELDRLYQAELARLREQHESELARLRAAPDEAPIQPSLLERARSLEVALLLGPFLEPGHAQLDNSFSAQSLPFSYAQLIATGALEAEPEGWRTLYKIGSSPRDRARTRWPAEPDAADLEVAQRAQVLLRELGPALIELGKLRP